MQALIAVALASPISVEVADLLAERAPAITGEATLTACPAPSRTLSEVSDLLQEVESALAWQELDRAVELLVDADAALACLAEPVAGSLAARAPYLAGVTAFRQGRTDEAVAAFAEARARRPQLSWDPDFEPAGLATFEQAGESLGDTVQLRVLPDEAHTRVWLDGKQLDTPSIFVVPGEHLLQLSGARWWTAVLQVDGASVLLVPEEAEEVDATWAGDRADDLDLLLGTALPEGARVELTLDGLPHASRVGTPGWEEVPVVAESEPFPWLATGGAALFVGGLAVSAVSYASMQGAAADAAGASGWEDWLAASGRYDGAVAQLRWARWVTLGGAVTTGVGIGLATGS